MPDTLQEGLSRTAPSRKRNADLYDSLLSIVNRNANNKPKLLPRRKPTEAQLVAHFSAGKDVLQQPVPRSPAAFQYTPHKKALPAPSIFSPATSKTYASPISGNVAPDASLGIQPAPLLAQQQARLGRSPVQSFTPTPMRSRLNQLPSRLGPARVNALPTPPQLRIQYLDSAPAFPSPAAHPAASSSHSLSYLKHQTQHQHAIDNHPDSPVSKSLQPEANDLAGSDSDAQQAHDQQQEGVPSPEFEDRMFGQPRSDNPQSEGFPNGLGLNDRAGQQAASEAHVSLPSASSSHQLEPDSRQSAIKRLAEKRAALSGFRSPVTTFQSPSRAAGLLHTTLRGSLLKRKASEALDGELIGPRASRQRMEAAITGISKAEEAIVQGAEAAKAASRSYPSPPTAILGFGPPGPASANNHTPTSGEHSWPADFFDSISKGNKGRPQIISSENGSEANATHRAGSLDSGAELSHVVSGDGLGVMGDQNGDGNDYGAVWRDAAESPAPPAAATGDAQQQVTSPPFSASPPLPASEACIDPASPSPTPSATPTPLPPSSAFGTPLGRLQQTPAGPPTTPFFGFAASPATVPAKGKPEGFSFGGNAASSSSSPAMFSAEMGTDRADLGNDGPSSSHAAEVGGTAAPVSGWGSDFLKGNQGAGATKASEAAAEAAKKGTGGAGPNKPPQRSATSDLPLSDGNAQTDKPAPAAAPSGWGSALLQSNSAAALKATQAAAEAIAEIKAASASGASTKVAPGGDKLSASPPKFTFGLPPGAATSQAVSQPSTTLPAWDPTKPITFGFPPTPASTKPATVDNSSQPSPSIPAAIPKASFSNLHADQGSAAQQEEPSTSTAAAGSIGGTAFLASTQAAASQEAGAAAAADAVNADKQKPDADKSAAPLTPAAPTGWGADLLASNQAAAAKAADAIAEAAKEKVAASKPASGGWGADLLAGNQAPAAKAAEAAAEAAKQRSDATTASATTPAPAPFKFGLPPGAQAGFGSTQQDTEANKTAVSGPVVSGPFLFGASPAATMPQVSSPPMAIPAAKDAAASQDASGSLARDGSWMSISPKSLEARQQDAAPSLPSTLQSQATTDFPQSSAAFGGFGVSGLSSASAPAINPPSSSAAFGQPSTLPAFGPSSSMEALSQALTPSPFAPSFMSAPQQSQAPSLSGLAFGSAATTAQQPVLQGKLPAFGGNTGTAFTFGQSGTPVFGGGTGAAPAFGQSSSGAAHASGFGTMPGLNQQPNVTSAGFGQQPNTAFSAFGQQTGSSPAAFGQPPFNAAPGFTFGQSAAAVAQPPMQASQQPAPTQQSACQFGSAPSNGQMTFGAQPTPAFGSGHSQAAAAAPLSAVPSPGSMSGFTLGASNDTRPSSGIASRRKVTRRKK